jgi:Na+-transporting NADH:ubiquinone oxidoreductase subunit NqrF
VYLFEKVKKLLERVVYKNQVELFKCTPAPEVEFTSPCACTVTLFSVISRCQIRLTTNTEVTVKLNDSHVCKESLTPGAWFICLSEVKVDGKLETLCISIRIA